MGFPIRLLFASPDYVVFFAAVEWEQAQRRPGPVDAIFAFGQACVLSCEISSTPIIHPQTAVVFHDGNVRTLAPFPRGVKAEDDVSPYGTVELEAYVRRSFYKPIIHE
jgi:hypothetical protein